MIVEIGNMVLIFSEVRNPKSAIRNRGFPTFLAQTEYAKLFINLHNYDKF